ncbi:Cupin-like domain-containing protein [Pseudoxanthomonas sp. GM95]|uniref:cupin-like domain-containing protein n=1 Tax=Pseudoxanthomonas sp. GM95 TaxID=1881043 RepID=UPI0008BDE462|nr:cupin-like domain-containing protein [Pseudoxanthomonas sp. GM95]SEK98699.1 Cupin-like domain-containing protein [Pseudoxanthomonas sp. GM95]
MPAAIDECQATGPLDLADLVTRGTPLVLRGLCAHWPLVQAAGTSDTAFAQALAAQDNGTPVDTLLMPPEAQGVVGYNAALDGFNYQHFKVSVTDVLKRLAQYSRVEHAPVHGVALQSAPIAACLPGLLETHGIAGLPAQIQPRLWLGNQVTTPAHFDAFHNIAVVACGRRRFTVFPPEQVSNLYIGPLDFAPTGAAISLARLDDVDDPRFPRLKDAMAHAFIADLAPGDALYLPPLWWHHVTSLAKLNALVNYWWQPPMADGQAPSPGIVALLHARLAFAGLAPAERAAWRALLEHYVFAEEDPGAHIPDARRGVLGALDAEALAALKQRIARSL